MDWLRAFGRRDRIDLESYCGVLTSEIFFKKLAMQASINLIANTLSRAEFMTYSKGKLIKKRNYYRLNIEPNKNQTASKFWRQIITNLLNNNECLVIQEKDMFYVVEDFSKVSLGFNENIYNKITINGKEIKKPYRESEVFYFSYNDDNIQALLDGIYDSYSKLIAISQTNYRRSKSKRGFLTYPTNYTETEEGQKDLTDLLNNRFKNFFNAEGGAVLPLTNKVTYTELEDKNQSKSSNESRDIRNFIDDIFDFVAIAFQIPPQLIKGNMVDTDKAVNNFLTFCINPIAKLISDEINRKLHGEEAYSEKTYIKIDTTNLKVVDLKDVANALDLLIRTGSFSIDDSLKTLGMEPLDTEWSKARWMTKNYARVETVSAEMPEGGE